MRADGEEARRRREERDAEYRAALGLPAGAALPASLGSVGGSRGGGHGSRINQTTTGRGAEWHHPTRSPRKRRRRSQRRR
jgi:hypothetical protein